MGNTPKELFDKIKAVYPFPTNICSLHKLCTDKPMCEIGSKKEVLDFDKIKISEDSKGHLKEYRKSVDAITYTDKGTFFCFAEIKGWKEFLKRNKNASAQNVQTQIDRYSLKEKMTDSIQICRDIAGENIFDDTPICFLIITDIEIESNPLDLLAENLNFLSETATTWLCNDLLKAKVETLTSEEIKEINKKYISCWDFDKTMNSI